MEESVENTKRRREGEEREVWMTEGDQIAIQ